MMAKQISADVAAAIEECWPDGVIEEFDTDESYFYDVQANLERDLRKIPGASLLWQTEPEEDRSHWDDDYDDEPPPLGPDSQSYHVFFLAPQGSEFKFQTETEDLEEPDDFEDPDAELATVTYRGNGWHVMPNSKTAATGHRIRAVSRTPIRPVNRSTALRHCARPLGKARLRSWRTCARELSRSWPSVAWPFWIEPFWICPLGT
jgi:hypothetical protein